MQKRREEMQIARLIAHYYNMTDKDRDSMELFAEFSATQNPRQTQESAPQQRRNTKPLRLVVG